LIPVNVKRCSIMPVHDRSGKVPERWLPGLRFI